MARHGLKGLVAPAIATGFYVLLVLVVGGGQSHAALPGANGRVAFDSNRYGFMAVFSMNADGSGVTPLATGTYDSEEPAWSPDGRQIAFTANPEANHRFQIYVMDADGSNAHRVSLGFGNAASPSWSPDGALIAFDTDVGHNSQIDVVRADGSMQWNLSNNQANDTFPTWSPDGTKIAFASDRGGAYDLWVMNNDGTSPVNLTNGTAGSVTKPDWSPDGESIAFTASRGGRPDIEVIDLQTRAIRQVTQTISMYPAWSADGSELSFAAPVGSQGVTAIYAAKPDGSGLRLLTGTVRESLVSAWQPLTCTVSEVLDGNSFACTDGRRVRLRGVSAPSGDECGAGWATAALASLFLPVGRTVRLQYGTPANDGGYDIASPLWRADDGSDYNISVVMAYVGLAHAAGGNTAFDQWLEAAEAWAQAAQWNMWADGGPFNGATSC